MALANSLSQLAALAQGIIAIAQQVQSTSRIMYMLGPFMFSRDTAAPNTLTRTNSYSWVKQARLGRDAASQFTGIGDDRFEIEGTIYPEYAGGIEQITLMRLLAGQGEPYMFVSGKGIVYGDYCITSIEETDREFNKDGSPKKVEFTITLERYGDDNNGGGFF